MEPNEKRKSLPKGTSNSYLTASNVEIVLLGTPSGGLVDKDQQCTCFSYKIPCCQKLANVKLFTAVCTLTLFVQSALSAGYTCAVLTTIERKFEMRSASMGLIVSAYEAGNLLTILFVGYYGCRQRVPAWLGCGSLLMSTGAAVMLIPHLVKLHFFRAGYLNQDIHEFDWHVCRSTTNTTCDSSPASVQHEYHWLYTTVFIVAQFICGIGMAPMVSLGAAYIDDHVIPRESSAFYLSFVYAGAALGPVFGYAMGAVTLTFDIESFLTEWPQSMSMDMPNWSGAWWGGYLLFALVLLPVSWMMCLFPKTLPSGRHTPVCENTLTTCSLRGMGEDAAGIVRSKYFLLINIAAVFQGAIVSGFCLFLPKYMESQFYVSNSVAGLLTGGVAVPAAAAGIVCGGWLTRKWTMTPLGMSRHIARIGVGTAIAFTPLFFIYCSPNPPIGIGITRRNLTLTLPEFMPERGFDLVEQTACVDHCACSPRLFQPVCDMEKQTSYLSPCIAGCSKRANDTFLECACASTRVVHEGLCATECLTTLIIFLAVVFCIAFLAGNAHLPVVFLIMRAVPADSKSLALALQMVFMRILAYIPAPMLFGSLIDLTCVLWAETNCVGDETGSCLFYDLDAFHRNYICCAFTLQLASCVGFWLNYYVMKRDPALNVGTELENENGRRELRARISTAVALQPMKGALIGLDNRAIPCRTYVTA